MFHSISGFSSAKKGYRKTQKKLGLLNPPSYLRLSPKKYQFFDGFPKTNLYLIELITRGDFNNKKTDLSA